LATSSITSRRGGRRHAGHAKVDPTSACWAELVQQRHPGPCGAFCASTKPAALGVSPAVMRLVLERQSRGEIRPGDIVEVFRAR
jgi:hypothetical protein